MKPTILVVMIALLCAVAISAAQVNQSAEQKHLMIATPEGPNIGLSAIQIERQPSNNIVFLRGNVEIKTKDLILHSEDATYNEATGEIAARGEVRIKLETQR